MCGSWNEKVVVFVFVVGISIVNTEIEVGSSTHLVLEDDFTLEVPYRDSGTVEGDARGLLLRLELVVYRCGRHLAEVLEGRLKQKKEGKGEQ